MVAEYVVIIFDFDKTFTFKDVNFLCQAENTDNFHDSLISNGSSFNSPYFDYLFQICGNNYDAYNVRFSIEFDRNNQQLLE